MRKISILKATDPTHTVFSFVPGNKIRIQVEFDQNQIPDHYRLQVLDKRNNARLNRYGKGKHEGFILDWPIPQLLRDDHFGLWHIQVQGDRSSFSQSFYVEYVERSYPLLLVAGPEVIDVVEEPEVLPSIIEKSILEIDDERQIFDSETPVTAIKGLGNTYATRLVKIQVLTVSDFLNYPDRVVQAETMRISDVKLSRMLQDAKFLMDKEAEIAMTPEGQLEIVPDDLISIKGIGPKSIERLARIGIYSQEELIGYEDLETLRKTLRMSMSRLKDVLSSLGKGVPPIEEEEPELFDPLNQPVIRIKGIGTKTAEKLNQSGIITVKDLLESDYISIKNSFSESSYNRWKTNAVILSGQQVEKTVVLTTSPTFVVGLTTIPGVGSRTSQRLKAAGVSTLEDLANCELDELAQITHFSKKRLSVWQAHARKLIL